MPRILFRFGFLTVVSLAISSCSGTSDAPVSETARELQAAIDIVVNEVVRPDSLDHQLIVYMLREPFEAGTEVSPYAPDALPDDVTSLPYLIPQMLGEDEWFFWIDDAPGAQFGHSTRYVFVGVETGDVRVIESQWWPYVNGDIVHE